MSSVIIVLLSVITIGFFVLLWLKTNRVKAQVSKIRPNLPTPIETIELVDAVDERCIYKCGHEGPVKYTVSIYGIELSTKKQFMCKRYKCPECTIVDIKDIVIRCALCRLPIFPGKPVALYDKSSSGIHQDIAHWVGYSACGCLRWDCCPCGAFFAGHWDGESFVSAFG